MDFNKESKQKSEDSESKSKTIKLGDLTQNELMDVIYTLNKIMKIYNSNIQKAMEMADKAEWETLKAINKDPKKGGIFVNGKRRKVKPKIYG